MLPISVFALLAIAGLGLSTMMPTEALDEPDDDTVDDDMLEDEATDDGLLDDDADALDDDDLIDDGNGVLNGTTEEDTVVLDEDAVLNASKVLLGDGDDSLEAVPALESQLSIYGENGNDVISVSSEGLDTSLDGPTFGIDVFGGEGDDTLSSSANAVDFFGGAGNDNISGGNYSEVYGDEGDDTLSGASWSDVYGGEGDDILTGGSAASVFGGAGDDTLIYKSGYDSSNVAELYGGEGNDTISLTEVVGTVTGPNAGDENGGAGFYPGAGDDTFELRLVLGSYNADSPFADDPVPDTTTDVINEASRLVAGEDVLIIDLERADDETGRALVSAEIETGETSATLVMTFEATDEEPELITRIRFGDVNVTMDDIVIRTP